MLLANPTLIQAGDNSLQNGRKKPPVFLIHDASGLVTSYFKIGLLGRPVYGIWDPKFDSDGVCGWESVEQIARAYVRLVRRVVMRGQVILGGWSFGGIIAVHMAHIMASAPVPSLRVVNVILIDSVYPRCERPNVIKGDISKQPVPVLPGSSQETREKLLTALMRSTYISDRWDPPIWSSRTSADHRTTTKAAASASPSPPPVTLIRANEMVPTENKNEISPLDRTRFLPHLGWEDLQRDFVSCVLTTAGNHFSLSDEHVSTIQSLAW